MPSPRRSVPPSRSSHTDGDRAAAGHVIRIARLGYVGVLILLFCVAFAFFGWPPVLWVLFAIPAAVALWIERTRTTVSSGGLTLRTVFGTRALDWSQIRGLRIPKRGFVRAHLVDGSEIALPAVSYDRLPHLVAASDGRIPDPFVQPAESDDGAEDPASDSAEGSADDSAAVPADVAGDAVDTSGGADRTPDASASAAGAGVRSGGPAVNGTRPDTQHG